MTPTTTREVKTPYFPLSRPHNCTFTSLDLVPKLNTSIPTTHAPTRVYVYPLDHRCDQSFEVVIELVMSLGLLLLEASFLSPVMLFQRIVVLLVLPVPLK